MPVKPDYRLPLADGRRPLLEGRRVLQVGLGIPRYLGVPVDAEPQLAITGEDGLVLYHLGIHCFPPARQLGIVLVMVTQRNVPGPADDLVEP